MKKIFDIFLSPLTWGVEAIDNGKFIKNPIVWLYYVLGAFAAILPILTFTGATGLVNEFWDYAGGWNKTVLVIVMILAFVLLVALAIYNFVFWYRRAKQLNLNVATEGSEIAAIPVYAHLVQTIGEFMGIFIMLAGTIISVLSALYLMLSFADDNFFVMGLGVLVLGPISSALTGYLNILIGHVIGESLRIKANICNDVAKIKTATVKED